MDALDRMLGIDPNDPLDQLAEALVKADVLFIDTLVAYRHARGLTRGDVAKRMGIGVRDVAYIENHGWEDTALSTIRRYALAVRASVVHVVASGARDA